MIGRQNAVALIGTPSDSAPQLVQLRKSKSFGIFDQQDGACLLYTSDAADEL